jgi:aminoglycoside phosphotransferase (APT) family kinase protein
LARTPERECELQTDAALARALIAAQFPQWATLPLARVESPSTDNDMYRLGDRMAARLPRRKSAVAPIEKEHAWLSRLAPCLPLAIPVPIAKGSPSVGYPYAWGVVQWITGEPPGAAVITDPVMARDLAGFVTALQAIDPTAGPGPGEHNGWRGSDLSTFDAVMRRRFNWLADLDDIAAIVAVWDRSLETPPWTGRAVWIHGDLKGANLLLQGKTVTGVLDWSAAGVGDPAVDLAPAWTLFAGEARSAFRKALAPDEAAWARGRAWALIEGVFGLSYYRGRNDALAVTGRRVLDAILFD